MSEQKYPWSCVPEYGNEGMVFYSIRDSSDQFVASTWANVPHEETAKRIVACVNACAGIPTEKLEAGSLETVREVLSVAELKQQRDELLSVVKEAIESVDLGDCQTAMNLLNETVAKSAA